MPEPGLLAAFAVAAFLIIVIPGPSVLFVVSRALAYGRRAALATVAGNSAGSFALAVAVAVGVGAVVQTSAIVYTTIKLIGAAYLVYLGVRAIRHRRALREALSRQASPVSDRRTWSEGFGWPAGSGRSRAATGPGWRPRAGSATTTTSPGRIRRSGTRRTSTRSPERNSGSML